MTWHRVTERVAETVHLRQIQRHGGGHGIRDEGLLDSALKRPQNLAAYGEPTAFDLAASYAFGIARNHPFVDGNKRTAFVVSTIFLGRNGYRFTAPEAEAAVIFIRLAAGEVDEAELGAWFRQHSSPLAAEYLVPEQDQ